MGKEKQAYVIRLLRAEDIAGIAAVEADAFTSPWPEELFVEELANPLAHYLVVERGEQIIGYAGYWLVLGEAQVTNIAVLKSCRGLGLGRRLVEELLAMAQAGGAESILLEVRPSNTLAQALYAKLGFEQVGLRAGYYQDNGEDALLMQKKFEENDE